MARNQERGEQPKRQPVEGWAGLLHARKWHYFRADGRSLCGKWLKVNNRGLEPMDLKSVDNCSVCWEKRLKMKAKQENS